MLCLATQKRKENEIRNSASQFSSVFLYVIETMPTKSVLLLLVKNYLGNQTEHQTEAFSAAEIFNFGGNCMKS
jgi:hypothetical protein